MPRSLANQTTKPVLPVYSNDPEVKRSDVLDKAWKYAGYKNYSRFVGACRSFFFTRQFRTLNIRIILAMQDGIAEMEDDLNALDNALSYKAALDIHNGTFREESSEERLSLIWKIKSRLEDYNQYIHNYAQIGTRAGVATKDIRSLDAWAIDNPNGILAEELHYLKSGDDLIYVLPKEKSPLRRIYNKAESLGLGWFRRHPTDILGYDPESTSLQEDERAETVISRVVLVIGLVMLIDPLWILEYVQGSAQSLAVITGFIILFLGLLTFTTAAKPFESLAAAAAYSAVLMVFLQLKS
ncbi:hypothetical protein MMC18_009219 [Xylographa bjoerkii]|nr:hypothetical protein [Xylographa bjoerkii]